MSNQRNGSSEKATPPTNQDVAVYLDFENLYVSLKTTVKMEPNFDLIMEKCREFGRVTVARAYADWSEFTRMLTSQMFANGFEPVYVPTRKFYDAKTRAEARKNSVDIHITIDIIKSLFQHENIDVFILISGDRDYVPLINQIRQHGKAVYALGVAGCTSNELQVAVDEMFFYHQLLEPEVAQGEPVDVYNQLMRAVRMARRRGYPTTLGIIKPIMKELVEGFNERNYKNSRGQSFQKFKDLVVEAQQRRLVKLVTNGATSEIMLWGEDPSALTPPRESGRQAPAREGARERDRGGRGRSRRGSERRPRETETETEQGTGLAAVAAGEMAAEEYPGAIADATLEESAAAADYAEAGEIDDEQPDVAANEAETAREEEVAEPALPEPEPTAEESLTGLSLDDTAWEVVREAVTSFGNRYPSPRRLLSALKDRRDEGRFGGANPTEADLAELLRQAVEHGRLQKVRKGFSTIYRLTEESAEAASSS